MMRRISPGRFTGAVRVAESASRIRRALGCVSACPICESVFSVEGKFSFEGSVPWADARSAAVVSRTVRRRKQVFFMNSGIGVDGKDNQYFRLRKMNNPNPRK